MAYEYEYAAASVHGAMDCDQEGFTPVGDDTNSCPGPEFYIGCRLGGGFPPFLRNTLTDHVWKNLYDPYCEDYS